MAGPIELWGVQKRDRHALYLHHIVGIEERLHSEDLTVAQEAKLRDLAAKMAHFMAAASGRAVEPYTP
jgi:hypothetical protein